MKHLGTDFLHSSVLEQNINEILQLLERKKMSSLQAVLILNQALEHMKKVSGIEVAVVKFEEDGDETVN